MEKSNQEYTLDRGEYSFEQYINTGWDNIPWDWNVLNTGVSVANGFNNTTRLEGVVEEEVVVWSILVGDSFDHLRKSFKDKNF